jgi:hypothetical protein
MARLSEGDWGYIDVNDVSAAECVFKEAFTVLEAPPFAKTEFRIRMMKDVRCVRLWQDRGRVEEWKLSWSEEREGVAELGGLKREVPVNLLLELALPPRPDGKYVVGEVEVTYYAGGGNMNSTGRVPLEIAYSAKGSNPVNPEPAAFLERVQKELRALG